MSEAHPIKICPESGPYCAHCDYFNVPHRVVNGICTEDCICAAGVGMAERCECDHIQELSNEGKNQDGA